MDILSHTLSGMAVGTVVAAFSNGGFKRRSKIILAGALAGAIPDIDAISLWSQFDGVFGNPLGLDHSGREIYYGKFWYSHHGMMHSLFMALMLPLIWWLIGGLVSRNRQPLSPRLQARFMKGKLGMIAFIIGYSAHLIEDMITPASSWGGVRLFFPMSDYYGGWGKIWWWNNYDLFLLPVLVILINIVVLSINRRTKQWTTGVISVAALLFVIQIFTRGRDFNNRSLQNVFKSHENASKEIQKSILPSPIYNSMADFDNSMNLNF